jgi:hypothetical protein
MNRAVVAYTKDENPGKGARDLALLFMTIWPPFRVEAEAVAAADVLADPPGCEDTPMGSGSESV